MLVARIVARMAEIGVREVGADELGPLVEVGTRVWRDSGTTAATLVDWRRQAEDMVWLVAERGGHAVGAALALVGWHNPRHVGIARVAVLPEHRGAGVGTQLWHTVSRWLDERRVTEVEGEVRDGDADSLAWVQRRGFAEVGRNSRLVLELDRVERPPAVDPPPGIEIVAWSEHPDLATGMYEVAREAAPDIPGNEDDDIGTFDAWLSRDMQGEGDRPEATFVALADGEVVGFAKLSISGTADRAFHDLTGVRRSWRGKGIAAALKRKQIAWAKENGYARLVTFNEERNEPIRRLNERHGYRVEPGVVVVRGPVVSP